MKAARFVMRSASSLGSAGLVPREVELFSRYSPSPLSMKQLLDFGEPARRARAGGAGAGDLCWVWGPSWEGLGVGRNGPGPAAAEPELARLCPAFSSTGLLSDALCLRSGPPATLRYWAVLAHPSVCLDL